MNTAQFNAYIQAESRVLNERRRQYELLAAGKFVHGPESSALSPSEILTVLTEEVGEVARHVCDAISNPSGLDKVALREEVVQVAAVAIGWVERLNREIAEEFAKMDASLTDADKEPQHLGLYPEFAPPAPARPTPGVIMYHDLYTEEELAEKADWVRDPEVGA